MQNIKTQQETILEPILEGQIQLRKQKLVFNEQIMTYNAKTDPYKRKFNVNLKALKENLPFKPHMNKAMNFTFQLNENKLIDIDKVYQEVGETKC